jgi:hypothetical protein
MLRKHVYLLAENRADALDLTLLRKRILPIPKTLQLLRQTHQFQSK